MTVSPRTTQQAYQADHYPFDATQALLHLRARHGHRQGWLEIGYIAGDPARNDPYTRAGWEWYSYENAPRIIDKIGTLARRYGDVYMQNTLFRKCARLEKYAIASPLVFTDQDRPAPAGSLQPTFRVHTSPGKSHDSYMLAEDAPIEQRKQLQDLAARANCADHSGKAIIKLERVAGTTNTKNGARHHVRFEWIGNIYTASTLSAAWTKAAAHAPNHTCTPDRRDWTPEEHAAFNATYPNRHTLLTKDGTPRMLKGGQGFYAWHNDIEGLLGFAPYVRVFVYHDKDGNVDDSWIRACIGQALRQRGYGFGPFAAFLWDRFYEASRQKHRGDPWLRREIARLWDLYAKLGQAVKVDMPAADSPQRGRPQRLTTKKYLAFIRRHRDTEDTLFLTRQEITEKLGVSVETVRRIERQLIKEGLIERKVLRGGRGTLNRSCVILLGSKIPPNVGVNVEPAPQPEQRSTTPQNDAEEKSESVLNVTRRPTKAQPGDSSPAVSVSIRLADAVRAAVEAAAGDQRLTFKRFLAAFREYFPQLPLSDKPLKREYQKVLKARSWERTLDKEREQAAKAEPAELKRKARSYAWNYQDARTRGYEGKAYMWGARAQIIEEEIARRQEIGDWPAERKRRSREKPQFAVSASAPLLALAAPDLTEPADEGAPMGGACFTQQPEGEVQPVIDSKADYLKRLAALGEWKAIERHCRLHKLDYQQVVARYVHS